MPELCRINYHFVVFLIQIHSRKAKDKVRAKGLKKFIYYFRQLSSEIRAFLPRHGICSMGACVVCGAIVHGRGLECEHLEKKGVLGA